MEDCREKLLNKIMLNLYNVCESENFDVIKQVITKCIGDYEITNRCTELAVVDDTNTKMIKLFFATKRTEGGSAETQKSRASVYKRFMQDINKPLSEIDVFDIRFWLAKEQDRVCLNTANNYRNMLSSLFKWLYSENLIPSNPMENINRIKHPDPIKTPFSSVEVDSLKSSCKTIKERAIIELLLSSGLRCKELCNLRWTDINFTTKDVTVIEGKGNKNRVTMMDDVTRKYLIEYKKSLDYETPYVFATKYRGEIKKRNKTSVSSLLKRVAKRACVENVYPHRFRRTFATVKYKRGMDVHMIQRLLGHTNINTTMIYINNDLDLLRDAYKRSA